jgi:Tol biopolymer transport system component
MRRMKISIWVIVFLWIIFFFIPPKDARSQESAEQLYEAAIFKKDTEGDLQGAVQLFLKVITKFPENRKVAAKAQLQVGICYEKLGLKDAQKAFQKVIDNYPEQADAVKMAQEKLDILLKAQNFVEKGYGQFRIEPVWTVSDWGGEGEVSPDGKYLSEVDWETGDVAVREIATGKKLRLTERKVWDSPEYAEYSRWSPDSKQLVYEWVKGDYTELRIIGMDNKKPRILYPGKEGEWVAAIGWSSDGKYILVGIIRGKGCELGLVSVADGSVRILKKLVVRDPYSIVALLSPDGRYIAYDRPSKEDSFEHDIFLLDIERNQEIPLAPHPAHDYPLAWAPDGKNILFASKRTGSMDAWIIQVDGGKPQGAPLLIKSDMGMIKPHGITRDGAFYYSPPSLIYDIYTATLDPESGKIISPPEKEPLPYEGHNYSPDWSPDGKYLVYTSMRGPGERRIVTCIYSVESGQVRELPYELNLVYPHWTPDGRSIFAKATVGDGGGIYLMNAQTGQVTLFMKTEGKEYIHSPQISHDGKWVIYVRAHETKNLTQVLLRNIETGEEKELEHAPQDNHSIALSRDGKKLAVLMRTEKDTRVLKVVPAAGGELKELHRFKQGGRWIIDIAWSPDGKYIYFSEDPDGDLKWELKRISSEGGKPQSLGLTMEIMQQLSFSADGRRITFASRFPQPELPQVWVMENFLPKEKSGK